ncbi:MAG: hemolysin family protein, partial [Acidimicrobiia bacterium]
MIYKIIAVFALVLANAFFVAAEFGLVAVRRTRVEELAATGNTKAVSARKAIAELNLILSACQLGITFSSLGLGWVGEPAIASMLANAFDFLAAPFNLIVAHGAAVAIAFAIITGLHVVLGELVPKNLAIARPEGTALWVASPIRWFTWTFRPLIRLFNEGANLMLRIMRVTPQPEIAVVHTPEELAIIVEESAKGGTIRGRQSEILTRTLEFPDKKAVDAMVPRTSAQALSADDGIKDVLELAEKSGFSRFPVWKERPDEFTGVVHLKEALKEMREKRNARVSDIARNTLVVPESLPLERVLIEMQRSRNHFAIVVDEFGSTAGIVTLE